MPLVADGTDGWALNRINRGPPYHVEEVGPYKLLQVEDAGGTCALSGPDGAVFCADVDQANALCEQANAGTLPVR
ncbi:hypothetical protein [Luteimonas saliphila]|uniref:hypothetical protein n=1 Tax=Luteimonas saliphila TaxID=2804919 RepID=UPI00192DA426|nr:hypothetical protein [Luteimonas saliphila]